MENKTLRIFSLIYWLIASVFLINYGIIFCITDIIPMGRIYSFVLGSATLSIGLCLYKSIIKKIED